MLAAAGEPDIKEKLLKGHQSGGKKFKVHLDGYDQTKLLKREGPGARTEFHYVTDDGDYAAFRHGRWKITFLTQEQNGWDVWDAPDVVHRVPRITDLRADPFEIAQRRNASFSWQDWMFRRVYLAYGLFAEQAPEQDAKTIVVSAGEIEWMQTAALPNR